ncbi:MAG: serine protease [Acidimicrobiaceae bacterium]|nr:serine protease [Acidimicrobiaceae bacterium]
MATLARHQTDVLPRTEARMTQLCMVAATYRVHAGDQTGTMFALELENQQYLVTARHLARDAGGVLQIEWEQGWISAPADLIGHCSGEVDISVYSARECLPRLLDPEWHNLGIEPDLKLGEDIRFYGFPYGLSTSRRNGTVPLPLVKAGIVSGFFGAAQLGPNSSFLIDGHNNPGFSGGPVVSIRGGKYRVAGVVSGYLPHDEDVRSRMSDENDERSEYVEQNSGIMLAWNIQHVVDLIGQRSASSAV